MKKLITTCFFLGAVSMVSFAQSKATKTVTTKTTTTTTKAVMAGPTSEQKAERSARTCQQQYGLTAEQYKGAYEAELAYERGLDQVRASGVEPQEGQKMQAGMERDFKLKRIMTADQYAKYEAANKKTN